MVLTYCLLTCVLATTQPGSGSDWLLLPQLGKGQELVYRGLFTEESVGQAVAFNRTYRMENRVLVLDVGTRGMDVALLTVLKARHDKPEQGKLPEPSSVRLELVQVDLQGRLEAPGISLSVPMEGPPTVEGGAFVEVPRSRVGINRSWEVHEEGRPPRSWKVIGTEVVNGTSCLKLVGRQQSDDWDRPRADRTAWHRVDTVWMAPRLGIAYRVERVIERRAPARREPTQRSVMRYELDSSLVYPGQLFEDRHREILQVRNLVDAAGPFLREPGKYGNAPFDALLAKVANHLDNQPPTPYREAVLQFQRRLEAAKRGEVAPVSRTEDSFAPGTGAAIGQPAPDFVASDFTIRESIRLRRFQGHPMLLVFYNPTAKTASEVLRFAQSVAAAHQPGITVLGLAVSDDSQTILQQRSEHRLTFPLLSARGLRLLYGVDATPRLVVLDAEGIVRGAYEGWGRETPDLVTEELNRCMRAVVPASK